MGNKILLQFSLNQEKFRFESVVSSGDSYTVIQWNGVIGGDMVAVVGNGHGDPSSIPGRAGLYLTSA